MITNVVYTYTVYAFSKNVGLYLICCNDSFWHEFCCIKETIQNDVKSRARSRVYESVHLDGSSVILTAKRTSVEIAFFSCLYMHRSSRCFMWEILFHERSHPIRVKLLLALCVYDGSI